MILAIALCACTPQRSFTVTVTNTPDCPLAINGHPLPSTRDQKAFAKAMTPYRGYDAVIEANEATTYRCIGGAIYLMQVNGIRNVRFRQTSAQR